MGTRDQLSCVLICAVVSAHPCEAWSSSWGFQTLNTLALSSRTVVHGALQAWYWRSAIEGMLLVLALVLVLHV